MLGLHCFVGYSLVAACGPLIAEASCCRARAPGPWASVHGPLIDEASCCRAWALGPWAQWLQRAGSVVAAQGLSGMWDLPGPGTKPMSPILQGGFHLTPGSPGKPSLTY